MWWEWLLGVRFMRACWKGLMPREAPAPEKRAGLTRFGSCMHVFMSFPKAICDPRIYRARSEKRENNFRQGS